MKILQLAPRYPFPPDDGGKIGIANITKEFSKSADVTFFTYIPSVLSAKDRELIRPYAELVVCKHSTSNSAFRIAGSLFRRSPLYITKHRAVPAKVMLKELVRAERFNVIHADHSCMAPLALELKKEFGIPVGIRLHNVEWTIWQRYAEVLPPNHPKRWYVQSQAKKLKASEKKFLDEADVVFAITEEDKQRALELSPGANIIVASAGVNLDEWKPDRSVERNQYELILATTYQWQHNIDAVRWFIENVQIKLHQLEPKLKLTLIGKNAPNWLADYRNIGVEPVGYVDRVQPYLNKAGIYVSPLFVGGGIRIKILEALAMELPVLATSIAAEGIKPEKGNGLFVCDSASEFIAAVRNLLENSENKDLCGRAVDYISENYSWQKNVGKMLDEYAKLSNKY